MASPDIATLDQIIRSLHTAPEDGVDLAVPWVLQYGSGSEKSYEAILAVAGFRSADTDSEKRRIADKLIEQLQSIDREVREGTDKKRSALVEERVKHFSRIVVPHEVVFECKNLNFGYTAKRLNLKNIDLTLRLGEISGIVGQNANGKTTLCRIIAGELAQDEGELSYPLLDPENKFNWVGIKEQIAYLPQEGDKEPWFVSVRQTLQIEASCCGIPPEEQDMAVEHIIQRLGLSGYENYNWGSLSGGFKLRFRLARLLLNRPKLLILDEPLANLDLKAQLAVLNDLRDLSRNFTAPVSIIITSQHIHEIEAIADRVIFLKEGEIMARKNRKEDLASRSENCFEFECALPLEVLKNELKPLPYSKLKSNGIHYVLLASKEIGPLQFLSYLTNRKIEIGYFRDISQSFTRDILYEE